MPAATGGALLVAVALAGCADATGPTDLTITTDALEDGAVGQLYSEGISAGGGGGDHVWTVVEGSLPDGLVLAVADLSGDALINGVPEGSGSSTFTVQVTDDEQETDSATFTIAIHPAPTGLRVENLALPPTVAGGAVEIPLRHGGGGTGSAIWSVADGALPPGLDLDPSGVIRGSATAVGEWAFIAGVSVGGESAFKRFTLRVVPNDVEDYHLTLFPVAPVPDDIQPHVDDAVERWEAVLTGDLGGGMIPSDFFGSEHCGGLGPESNGTSVDDLLVLVQIDSIDGPGSVLAQAGPCGLRADDLPFVGVLTLDSSDLLPITGTNTLTSIIAHELGHVLGFGSIWDRLGLLSGAGTEDPRFTGEQAVSEWQALGGTGDVPLENQGGEGTAEGHLREQDFDRELMTGFVEEVGVAQPLSRVSVASMADLGYAVDLGAADPFALTSSLVAASGRAGGHLGWDIVGAGPVRVLEALEEPGGLR